MTQVSRGDILEYRLNLAQATPTELRIGYQFLADPSTLELSNHYAVGFLNGRMVHMDPHNVSGILIAFDSAAYYRFLKRQQRGRSVEMDVPKISYHISTQDLFASQDTSSPSPKEDDPNRVTDEELHMGLTVTLSVLHKYQKTLDVCKTKKLDTEKDMPSIGYLIHHHTIEILKREMSPSRSQRRLCEASSPTSSPSSSHSASRNVEKSSIDGERDISQELTISLECDRTIEDVFQKAEKEKEKGCRVIL